MEQKERVTRSQTAEDAWIAKYRAALGPLPVEKPRVPWRALVRNAYGVIESRMNAMLTILKRTLQHRLFRPPAPDPIQQPQVLSRRSRVNRGPRQKARKPPLRAA